MKALEFLEDKLAQIKFWVFDHQYDWILPYPVNFLETIEGLADELREGLKTLGDAKERTKFLLELIDKYKLEFVTDYEQVVFPAERTRLILSNKQEKFDVGSQDPSGELEGQLVMGTLFEDFQKLPYVKSNSSLDSLPGNTVYVVDLDLARKYAM